jgi:phosphate transport system permease protein
MTKGKKILEKIIEYALLLSATAAVLIIALIAIFVFKEGLPVIVKTGFFNFLTGTEWSPTANPPVYGILPMIYGSIVVTIGSLIIGVPLGISCAIFLAEVAPKKITKFIRPAIELLAGIPSVVYGLFGMIVIVQLVKEFDLKTLGNQAATGYGILAASIILAIMILPTIINISEDAIKAVPREYKEGSLALGATHWQSIVGVILPAAKSGILAGVVLGMGRAIGETMAVIMVAGNTVQLTGSIFEPIRTLTTNIAIEIFYASGQHQQALFATGIVLFLFIMMLNMTATVIIKRQVK